MPDLFDKCRAWPDYQIATAANIYPYYHPITRRRPGEVETGGRWLVMAGSNDYLGLAGDPRLAAAAVAATKRYGTTCSGSRLLSGTLDLHEELEAKLAEYLGFERVLVVSTGYQTNLCLAALLGKDDTVYADQDNHASLVDAARLGFARHRRFRHRDVAHLEELITREEPGGGKLIVSDGMFSMEGDLCDLAALGKVRHRFAARLAVDSAHDFGLFGANGRGIVEHVGAESEVDILTGTFSKCAGSVGGFIAAEADVISYLRHRARSVVFSASLPPASAAAALAALEIIRTEPERRGRVLGVADRMRDALGALGFHTGPSTTPVVPVLLGDGELCFRFWTELYREGVFANAIIPPAVPPGRSLIRTTFTAAHSDSQLERVIAAFATAGRRLGVI